VLSSSDVSQMFAAQNQMFMGQQQYAQQIGIPAPNMSLSAWGSDPRQRAFGAGGTFGGHAPVSYAPSGASGPGYGAGSRIAGGAMSALGGIASAGSMLAFDPISSFAKGAGMMPGIFGSGGMSGGIGAMAGGGIMGGMAAAAPPMLLAMAAQKGISAFVGGGQQQQAIQSQLGGFGFSNSNSRTGQGFSRDDAQMIGNQVRAIAHVPEMMTSVEELTKLIPKLKASGVMSGVRDAAEFNSRFKEAVKTLRDVSKVMGTTMEEASQFFEHSRSVGFLGRTDQIKNAMNVKFTAAQTGMSDQQVMQLQQGGAQMAVGRGVRRQVGTAAITNMAQQFGRGMQSGNISQADLEDMTGAQGEAAVGAAAQQMTEKLARFAESTAAGRASMMGLAEFDDKGRYKGINKELAKRYAAGDITKEDLMKRIATFSDQQKISASRKVGSMAIEFAGATGPGGAMSFMKNVLAEGGHTGEAGKFMMQKYGFTEVEVDVMSQMEGMQSGAGEDRQKKAFERKRQMEADISDRTDPSKIMSRIGTKLKSGSGLAKVEQEGAKMFNFIGKAYDEFIDDVVGRYSAELSEKGAQRLLQSFQSQKGKEDMKALFAMKTPQYSTERSASTLGKLVGGMQMGSEVLMTGGLSLLATGGLNEHGKKFDRDMGGIMKWFGGAGREGAGDVMQQREMMQESFGMKGAEGSEINDRLKELRGMGGGADSAKSQVQDAIAKLDKEGAFSDATQADRVKMLTEELEGRTSTLGFGGSKVSEVQKFIKSKGLGQGGANAMSEAAMALAGDQLSEDYSDQEAKIRDMAKVHSKSIQAATIHAKDVFGDETGTAIASAISGDFEVGTNIRKAMDDKNVQAALQEKDPEKGARALEKALGKPEGSVSEDEFKKTQGSMRKINAEIAELPPEQREAKKREMISAVGSLQMAEFTKNIGVTQIAARDLASGMGPGELQSALKAFANAEGGEDAYSKQVDVQSVVEKQVGRLAEARAALKAAKTPEQRAAAEAKLKGLTKELGSEMTERIAMATGKADRAGNEVAGQKFESAAKAAEAMGVSESDVTAAGGLSATGKLDKSTIDKIKRSKVAAEVTGGALVGTEAQAAKSHQEKMEKAFDSIDKTNKDILITNKLLTSTIAIAHGVTKEKVAEYDKSQESKDVAKGAEGAGGKK
jgi:hypothetical protein